MLCSPLLLLIFCVDDTFAETISKFKWRADKPVSQYRENESRHNCGECHKKITEQFARSKHARAYENGFYQKRISGLDVNKISDCNRCHAPKSIFLKKGKSLLKPRTSNLSSGIRCVTCHQNLEYMILGPFEAVEAPHRSQKSHKFRSSETCLPCHGQKGQFNLVASWRESTYSATDCIDCHMPSTEEMAVQHISFIDLPLRNVGDHSFPASTNIEMLKMGIDVEVAKSKTQTIITITNSGAGHLVPGGRFKAINVAASGLSNKGRKVNLLNKEISSDIGNRIAPGGSIKFMLGNNSGENLYVRVEYRNKLSVNKKSGIILYDEKIN